MTTPRPLPPGAGDVIGEARIDVRVTRALGLLGCPQCSIFTARTGDLFRHIEDSHPAYWDAMWRRLMPSIYSSLESEVKSASRAASLDSAGSVSMTARATAGHSTFKIGRITFSRYSSSSMSNALRWMANAIQTSSWSLMSWFSRGSSAITTSDAEPTADEEARA